MPPHRIFQKPRALHPCAHARPALLLLLAILAALLFTAPVRAQSFSLSADAASLPIRTPLHLTATVGPSATGSITFFDGSTPLATLPLSPLGTVVYATAALGSGAHTVSASYSGDALHPAQTSQFITVTITKLPTPPFTLSPNYGTVLTTQQVSLAALGLPPDASGSITFLDQGNPVATTPIQRTAAPSYLSLGDDLPAGVPLAASTFAFPALLAQAHSFAFTSGAIAGQAACDVLIHQYLQKQLVFTQAGAPLTTLMVGSTDTSSPATEPTFQLCHQAALAWLAVPREFKVLPGDPGVTILSGTWNSETAPGWSYYNTYGGLTNVSGTGTVQFTLTSTGAPLYLWYFLNQAGTGLFTVTVDGVPDPTLYSAQPAAGTNTASGYGVAILRVPVAAGLHTVQFSLQAGTLSVLGVGTPPTAADGSLHPTVLVSDLPSQSQSAPRDPAAVTTLFAAGIQANVALLAADGLDLRLVPTRSFMTGAPEAMSDQVHPNALGHTQLAGAFESLLPAVSLPNITTFQPTAPAASATLLTPGQRTLTAVYSGDAVYAPATSAPYTEAVNDGATSTTLTTPSPTVPYQTAVLLTATVSPASASGWVTFTSGTWQIATTAVTLGVATFTQVFPTGSQTITATFKSGDGHAPSTSAPIVLTVTGRPPGFSFSAQPQGIPAASSAAVLTAYLAPIAVSGSVTFSDTATGPLATVPVVDGAAILPVNHLTPGTHTYTATYSGDAVYEPLTSAPASITLDPLVPLQTSLIATLTSSPTAPVGSPTTIAVDALAAAVPLVPFTPAAFSPALNATTVFIGDSITDYWPLLLHSHGIVGQLTSQMLARFAADILNQGFERVVILGGTNDILHSLSPDITVANLAGMAAQATAAGMRPILATIPPIYVTNQELSAQVFALNAAIRSLAQQNGYPLLDYYAALVQHPEVFVDGIHPDSTGYAYMEAVLAQTLIPPTGSVTLSDGASATLSATGTAILTSTSIPAGAQQLTVAYAGNTSLAPACATVQTSLTPAISTTVLHAQPLAGYTGNSVAFTASVKVPGALAPTGSITFLDNGRPAGTASLTGATASLTTSNLIPGPHAFTATYTGDTNFNPSASVPADLISPFSNTSLALSTTAPNAFAGTPVTLTATVTPASATGAVTFLDGNAILARQPLAPGLATFTTSTLALGPHALTALYSGDPSDSIATSPILVLTVNPNTTTLTLAPVPPTQPVGNPLRLAVSIVPTASTSAITFLDSYTAPGQSQATIQTLGQATLAAGAATFTYGSPPPGTHVLSAAYAGDPADLPSTSATLTAAITPLTSTITLTTPTATVPYATPVNFTVTVSPATATGSINLRDASGSTLAQSPLSNATATFTLPNLFVGLHTLTAAYAGDLDDAASTSPALALTITPGPTTLTLTPAAATIAAGSPVTLTATVSPATATGTITFRDPQAGTLGQAILAGGTATLSLPSLPAATYTITAAYSGDPRDAPSLSNSITTQVALTPTTIVLTAPPAPLTAGTPLTLTATLSPAPTSGSITFTDATTTLGTTLLANGTATLQLPSLAAGTHTLRAAYAGSTLLAASTSAPSTLNVTTNITATTLTLAQPTIAEGSPVTFDVQVSATSTLPTGAVTIRSGAIPIATATLTRGPATTAYATLTADSTVLGPGTFTVAAFYSGDATEAPSDSSAQPVTFTIVRAPTSLSFTIPAASLPVNTPATVAATVTGPSPSQIPTGTVTFLLNGTPILSVPVDPTGNASAKLPGQPVGAYALTAVFNPTGIYAPATATNPQTLTFTPPLSLAFQSSTVNMTPNSQAAATLLITPLSGFTGAVATQCTTSAPFITCTLSAPSSVSGPTTATVHLAVSNTTASVSQRLTPPLAFAFLLLLPFSGRRLRKLKLALFAVLLTALTNSLSGCSSNNFQQIPTGYQLVTVTVTANQTPIQAPLNIQVTD